MSDSTSSIQHVCSSPDVVHELGVARRAYQRANDRGQLQRLTPGELDTERSGKLLHGGAKGEAAKLTANIVDELGRGKHLEFRDVGVFEARVRAARKAQNPETMEKVLATSKRMVKFKVGRLMKERLLLQSDYIDHTTALPGQPATDGSTKIAKSQRLRRLRRPISRARGSAS